MRRLRWLTLVFVLIIGLGLLAFLWINQAIQEGVTALEFKEIAVSELADGDYLGASQAGVLEARVNVKIQDQQLQAIELLEHTTGLGQQAEDMIPEMLRLNTDDVAVVSGATASSQVIRHAVNQALQEAIQEKE